MHRYKEPSIPLKQPYYKPHLRKTKNPRLREAKKVAQSKNAKKCESQSWNSDRSEKKKKV